MPPVNDNWASATSLGTGGSGVASGTNIGATAQAGEPANNGVTVWYAWTPATDQTVYFSTLYNASVGFLNPLVPTVLQVFTGSAVNALTEVGYQPNAGFTSKYAGYSIGSFIAFDATAATTYYIRVDGVGGATGLFPLSFDTYYYTRYGGCGSGCYLQYTPHLQCVATGTVSNIEQTSASVVLGTFSAGYYFGAYCGGAMIINGVGFVAQGPSNTGDIFNNGPSYVLAFDGSSITTNLTTAGSTVGVLPSPFGGTGTVAQPSIVDAENEWGCLAFSRFQNLLDPVRPQYRLTHNGGTITLFYYSNASGGFVGPYGGNLTNTGSLPNFTLYRHIPAFSLTTACASWTTPGSAATCTFVIHNNNPINWDSVTCTLDTAGGISGSSSTTMLFSANADNTFTITFNATTSAVVGTLRLSSTYFPADVVVTVNLAPIVSFSTLAYQSYAGYLCSGHKVQVFFVIFHNDGYWKVNPSVAFDTSGAAHPFDVVWEVNPGTTFPTSGCTPITSASSPFSSAFSNPCDGSNGGLYLAMTATGFTTPSKLKMTLTDLTSGDMGVFNEFFTIPN